MWMKSLPWLHSLSLDEAELMKQPSGEAEDDGAVKPMTILDPQGKAEEWKVES